MKYPTSHSTPFLPTFPGKIVCKRIESAKDFTRAPAIPLSTFRMNTCKSVSKQRTLSPFRMNTYAKTGGGGPISTGYGPGTSLTEQTGSIPDTARTLATACKTSACHGKRVNQGMVASTGSE